MQSFRAIKYLFYGLNDCYSCIMHAHFVHRMKLHKAVMSCEAENDTSWPGTVGTGMGGLSLILEVVGCGIVGGSLLRASSYTGRSSLNKSSKIF